MKRFLLMLALLAGLFAAQGQTPEDQYIYIYNLIQEGDALAREDQPAAAVGRYREAHSALQRFQHGYPEFNERVVKFRLNYLVNRISALTPAIPAEAVPAAPGGTPAAPAAPGEDLGQKVGTLENQVRQLQSDKSLLEAKLKEALALRPAGEDPQELAKAHEQIRSLTKENELLKTGLEQLKAAGQGTAPEPAAETQQLKAERDELQTRVAALTADAEAANALRQENEMLKSRLSESSKPASAGPSADAQAQLASLQSEKELLRLEKIALEAKIKQLLESGAEPKQAEADASIGATRMKELESQVASLRSRLQVLEASKIPYTAEELTLFRQPSVTLAGMKTPDVASRTGSADITLLAANARRFAAEQQFDKAEDSYQQLLQSDANNLVALGNLATIQIQQGKLTEAEENLNRALKVSPKDAFSLSALGVLKFRQKEYDEALELLSRAAEVAPQNAEVQNRLGLVLSEKGMRGPAETALRKAIQLQPGYGEAHHNLAVVYITQNPPLVELARWHYQKGLAAGQPKNVRLEEMLEAASKSAK